MISMHDTYIHAGLKKAFSQSRLFNKFVLSLLTGSENQYIFGKVEVAVNKEKTDLLLRPRQKILVIKLYVDSIRNTNL